MDEQNSNMMPAAPEKETGRSWVLWTVLIVVIAAAVVFVWWQGPAAEAPTAEPGDTTSAIESQLNYIDVGDLEGELQTIDEDLNQL